MWGPYSMQDSAGATTCPRESRRNNSFTSVPQQSSSPSSLVPGRQRGADVSTNIYVPNLLNIRLIVALSLHVLTGLQLSSGSSTWRFAAAIGEGKPPTRAAPTPSASR